MKVLLRNAAPVQQKSHLAPLFISLYITFAAKDGVNVLGKFSVGEEENKKMSIPCWLMLMMLFSSLNIKQSQANIPNFILIKAITKKKLLKGGNL